MSLVVDCRNVVHVYRVAGTDVAALRGVDLQVAQRQRVALLGPSGSGKSTLMSIVGAVTRPSAGKVDVLGVPLHAASARVVHRLRRQGMSLLLQGAALNLLPYADPMANVRWTVRGAGRGDPAVAAEILAAFELDGTRTPVGELPPADQQVVALATAMSVQPRLLLADEPTSLLSAEGRDRLLSLLVSTTESSGTAVLMVTHDEAAAGRLDRMVHLRDGRIAEEATTSGRFAVLGSDGSVQLPRSATERWPSGTLLAASDDGDVVSISRAKV